MSEHSQWFTYIVLLLVTSFPLPTLADHTDKTSDRLAKIGPAPDFTLTTQEGTPLSSHELRGKVVTVSFVYTGCPDICPLLTVKLLGVKREIDREVGTDVRFVSITMDPQQDTPDVLKGYADAFGLSAKEWAFLTGTEAEIREVARGYGVYYQKQPDGFVDHNLLTSIVDRTGTVRVQYMGTRFDPREFVHDLRSVLDESPQGN